MTHREYMAFFERWLFYQFPRDEDNWTNINLLRVVAKIVQDPEDLLHWAARDCWSMYHLAMENKK